MKYSVILNPAAGKGNGEKLLPRVQEVFGGCGESYELMQTEGRGDATRLARNASGEIIVAVGGDGTVNEIANGLVGDEKCLGIIPAGSGNDFIKAVKVPKKFSKAVEVLFQGKIVAIDVGSVRTGGAGADGSSEERHFVNGVGIGFDAAVAVKTAEIKYLTGVPLYLAAVFRTLGKYSPPSFTIETDGRTTVLQKFLIAIGNGPCAGGGFYLTPDAVIDDGLLDVCLIEPVSIPTILRLMPKVMVGKHRNAKQVKFLRCKQISLDSPDRFYVHADGEIVGRNVRSVQVGVRAGGLRVISGM